MPSSELAKYPIEVAIIPYNINYMNTYSLFNEIFLTWAGLEWFRWVAVSDEQFHLATLSIVRGYEPILQNVTIHIKVNCILLTWGKFRRLDYIKNNAHNTNIIKKWSGYKSHWENTDKGLVCPNCVKKRSF